MEVLNQLSKTKTKSKRRIGRGFGSTNGGHTVGRGSKGQKARSKVRITFDGQKIKKGWIKRLPFLRGKHRLLSHSKPAVFSLSKIDKLFKKDETVTLATIAKKTNLSLKKSNVFVKILATGEITKAINFKNILLSESAKKKIISAGGKID
jgi:large subunit ribosomal protein L15